MSESNKVFDTSPNRVVDTSADKQMEEQSMIMKALHANE